MWPDAGVLSDCVLWHLPACPCSQESEAVLQEELPSKEAPVVHTETKTITYESSQVRRHLGLKRGVRREAWAPAQFVQLSW